MNLKVSDTLLKLPSVDYRKLKEFQGNLKDLSEKSYNKLKNSLERFGWITPLFIWKYEKDSWIIDAHQRIRVLKKENATPYELPYIEIQAENEKEARAKLLVISSQYGKITPEGFYEFTHDFADDILNELVNFDALYGLDSLNINPDENEAWKGMPSYESNDVQAFRSIVVHFKDQEAVNQFASTVKHYISDKTKYMWFPEIEIDHVADKQWKAKS